MINDIGTPTDKKRTVKEIESYIPSYTVCTWLGHAEVEVYKSVCILRSLYLKCQKRLHFCFADFAILDTRLPFEEKSGLLENLVKINEYEVPFPRMRLRCVHIKSVAGSVFKRLHSSARGGGRGALGKHL